MRRAVTRHPARPRAGQGAGAARQGARAPPLPHAALPARLPADLRGAAGRGAARRGRRRRAGGRSGVMTDGAGDRRPLVLVSNRGPVTFQDDGSVKRGGGGLVTALTGLASHREAVWIASAMTEGGGQESEGNAGRPVEGDAQKSEENDGRPFEVETPDGGSYYVKFVASDPEAYERFYSVVANPLL